MTRYRVKAVSFLGPFLTLCSLPAMAQVASIDSDIKQVRALMAAGSVSEAKSKLGECAKRKSPQCQFLLAEWLERGEVFERDQDAARRLYELSYQGGYEPAGAAILRMAKSASQSDANYDAVSAGPKNSDRLENDASPFRKPDIWWDPAKYSFGLSAGFHSPEVHSKWSTFSVPPGSARAPDLFGFRLGQPDSNVLDRIQSGGCDEAPTSSMRRCVGTIALPMGSVYVDVSFLFGRVENVIFVANKAGACSALRAHTANTYGKPKWKAGAVKKALLAGLSEKLTRADVPDIFAWGRKNEWALLQLTAASGASCILALTEYPET